MIPRRFGERRRHGGAVLSRSRSFESVVQSRQPAPNVDRSRRAVVSRRRPVPRASLELAAPRNPQLRAYTLRSRRSSRLVPLGCVRHPGGRSPSWRRRRAPNGLSRDNVVFRTPLRRPVPTSRRAASLRFYAVRPRRHVAPRDGAAGRTGTTPSHPRPRTR